MQIPIKWNDYMPGMSGLAILRRKLPKNSNWLIPSGVYKWYQRQKSGPQGGREYVSVPDPFSKSHLDYMTLKHLIEPLSMMCSPDHPSRTLSTSFYLLMVFSHLHLQTGAHIGPLSPSLGQIEGLWKRTPKSSSAVKRDLHGLGWVQSESEKSKANKLTHRHTHAFRANIERSRAFLTITRLINIVELIIRLERMFTCSSTTCCNSGAYPGSRVGLKVPISLIIHKLHLVIYVSKWGYCKFSDLESNLKGCIHILFQFSTVGTTSSNVGTYGID